MLASLTALVSGCELPLAAPSGPTVTTVLVPRAGSDVTSASLAASAAILGRRLAAVSRAHVVVTVRNGRLVVQADPAATQALPDLLAPGHLALRRVVEAVPLTPSAGSATAPVSARSGDVYSPASFTALQCGRPENAAGGAAGAPGQDIVACDSTGTVKFHLAPAQVVGADVKSATASGDQYDDAFLIDVSFTARGQSRFTDLTRETYGAAPPTNQIAIVVDGVVSAPVIQAVITGDAQITGAFSKRQAEALAASLSSGILPLAFAVER